MQIHLTNTLSRTVEPFKPLHDGVVRMYSCGPTVYNTAHIGNMRAFLFTDLLQRVLRVVGGFKVQWVMNITDIDDKTIRDSAIGSPLWQADMGAQTEDARENLRTFTEFYAKVFVADIAALKIHQASFHAMPRATHYIPQMQELIRLIAEKGFAYERGGSVYFNVAAWRNADKYGKLFKIDAENFQEGVRIDADEYDRESVSDFVLWKGKKDGEPAWDFEFEGKNILGRPGWHIECSAMARELLGLPFDIHTGGIDLCFPHHEDEIAQSKAGYGVEPVNYWCHNEFLEVEGDKMSKSKGNFYTVGDLTAKGIDPIDIRWLMLSAHYGSRLNFTFAGLEAGRKARFRVQEYIYDLWERSAGTVAAASTNTTAEALRTAVFGELANDLQTPKAMAELFTFINRNPASSVESSLAAALLGFLQELNDILEVWQFTARPAQTLAVPPEVAALAEARWQAKRTKNFAESDRLRGEIAALGFVVKDTKDGYTLEVA
ncbi:MAG: cysteine--tRNA ligase [Candidatus Kapabacteria bacterium]|jgi:cysteinyl-tRNA synthetase|nr:cysteine--tRNA ligase [Candidatus Kapabacteria bacterium]